MPTTAAIRFDGVGTPKETYKIGDTVNLTNNDDTGVSSWAWTLLSKPSGSTASIASPTSAATSFVVDKEGTYLVRLVVNDTLPDEDQDTGVARILHQHTAATSPAKDETGEGDPTEGWAFPHRRNFSTFDKRLGLADRRTVKYVGAGTTGPRVLTITGTVTLPNGDVVPTVDNLGTGSFAYAHFLWDGGALATNDVVSVLARGLTGLVTNPDTLVAFSPLYIGATGALTKTIPAADRTQFVGYCVVVSGPNVVLWFEPQWRYMNASLPQSVIVDNPAVAGTLPELAHMDHQHTLFTYAIAPSAVGAGAGSAGTAAALPSRGDHSHQVTTATPVAVTPDAAPAAGASNSLSRADHQHGITTYASNPADTAAAPAPGTSGFAPSRGDHVHAHGNLGGGSQHAIATTSVAGFLSAADKTKLDGLGPSGTSNYLINGAMDIWQRGTSFTISQLGVGLSRAYSADRWFGFERKDSGVSTFSSIFTKQSGAAGQSRFSLRVQKNGATSAGFAGVSQEVDRRWVEQLRGKKVTLRFKVKTGAGFTGSPLVTINANGAGGTEDQWWGTYGAGTETDAFFYANPGTSFIVKTFTTALVLPSDLKGLAINLGVYHDFNLGGGATDFIEFAEVSLVAGETAPTDFAYAAGNIDGETAYCKRFYDKSYELDTAPGSSEYNSAFFFHTKGNGTILNLEEWYIRPRPKFQNEMRVTPTVSLWTYSGTAGSWQVFDTNRASVAIEITKKQFTPANNTGGNVVLGVSTGEDNYGAWAADAEI